MLGPVSFNTAHRSKLRPSASSSSFRIAAVKNRVLSKEFVGGKAKSKFFSNSNTSVLFQQQQNSATLTPPPVPEVNVFINGIPRKINAGASILEAFQKFEKNPPPTLCYHPSQQPPPANCRLCLVQVSPGSYSPTESPFVQHAKLVEANPNKDDPPPPPKLIPSCANKVAEGQSYWSNTPTIHSSIRNALKLILSRHPVECPTCEANNNCQLQELLYTYNVKDDKYTLRHKKELLKETHSLHKRDFDLSSNAIIRDMDKCILCTKCIKQCNLQAINVYSMALRGGREFVSTLDDRPIAETECISCGQVSTKCCCG